MMTKSIRKILIANRGEIACRVMETASRMGISTVAVYSDADRNAMHVKMADEAIHIGPSEVNQSYLVMDKIIDAAKQTGADAIHPGYGFLSENADFADRLEKESIRFIGPSADAIRAMGLKDAAKAKMIDAGVPVVPGYHGKAQDDATLQKAGDDIGYPVLIKAVAGGGGKGMRLVEKSADFVDALKSAQREAASSFGDDRVLVEKFVTSPRHIEVQVFGDDHGNAVHLFERDCSIQRRHQKVVEEAPAPDMGEVMRQKMGDAAVKAAKAIAYSGAGTIEFIVDGSNGLADAPFYFMEMNTRLQVEHPVTEAITGEDLVEWQIRVAEGQPLPKSQDELSINGHAIEVRLYAEDPDNEFLPQTGTLSAFHAPDDIARVDTGVQTGDEVSIFYDPMIAKLIVHGDDRNDAIRKMDQALRHTGVAGLKTNLSFLLAIQQNAAFIKGALDTGFIAREEATLFPARAISLNDLAFVVAAVLEDRAPSSSDPWDMTNAWQLNLPHHETMSLLSGDERFDLTLTHNDGDVIVTHGDETMALSGLTQKAMVHMEDHNIALMRDGVTTPFHLFSEADSEDEATEGPGSVTAAMPGKIIDVMVKAGDEVTFEQPLVVMEAMKMEYTLTAPKSGRVDEVFTQAGEQVNDGALLLRIEESDGETK